MCTKELEHMQAQMKEMQLEIDILKETIDVLKKDPGVDQTTLKNSEKQLLLLNLCSQEAGQVFGYP